MRDERGSATVLSQEKTNKRRRYQYVRIDREEDDGGRTANCPTCPGFCVLRCGEAKTRHFGADLAKDDHSEKRL